MYTFGFFQELKKALPIYSFGLKRHVLTMGTAICGISLMLGVLGHAT